MTVKSPPPQCMLPTDRKMVHMGEPRRMKIIDVLSKRCPPNPGNPGYT